MVWSEKLPDQKSLVRRMVKYPLSENNDTVQGPLHAQGYSSAAGTIWQTWHTGDDLLHENEVSFPPRSGGEAANCLFAQL